MHARIPRIKTACLLLVLVMAAGALAGCGGQSAEQSSAIGVNAVAADPSAYSGTITMKAVVQQVDPQSGFINLIDPEEYATCGLTPCGGAGQIPLFVPTAGEPSPTGDLYEGQYPALEEEVLVVGEVKELDTGLVFDVARIDSGSKTVLKKR